MQLASALAGDHVLKPLEEKIATSMTVREGLAYMEEALARFFEAGLSAKRMRVDERTDCEDEALAHKQSLGEWKAVSLTVRKNCDSG